MELKEKLQFSHLLLAGDILHCTSESFLAKAIQTFSRSRINHSALIIEIWGELYVIDSQRDGTNPRKYEDWCKEYNYKFQVTRNISKTFDKVEFSKKALSKSGRTPYDFKSLLWYQPIYQLTGKWKGKTGPAAEGRMYCSEYAAWTHSLPNWWRLSPQEVFEYTMNSRDYIYIKPLYE